MKNTINTNNSRNGKVSYVKITIVKTCIEVLCITLTYIIVVELQIHKYNAQDFDICFYY
jgi:hypothetical protein